MVMASLGPTHHLSGRIAFELNPSFILLIDQSKVELSTLLVEGYVRLQHSPFHSRS